MKKSSKTNRKRETDLNNPKLRLKLVGLCETLSFEDLSAMTEYVTTGSYQGIYAKCITEINKAYNGYSTSLKETSILEFYQELLGLVNSHFTDKYKEIEGKKTKETQPRNPLRLEERLVLVSGCKAITILDLPAITEYVITGKTSGFEARKQAGLFIELAQQAIYHGDGWAWHLINKVAELIQLCFSGVVEVEELIDDLSKISNTKDN